MNKAIYIGELALNVAVAPDGSASTRVGDRITAAAVLDARMGVDTVFLGEAAADSVGDHIVARLAGAGVDTGAIDRYSEGATAVTVAAGTAPAGEAIATVDDAPGAVLHSSWPGEPANPVWPRIEAGDVMVYGSYMALDKRNHPRVMELAAYAKARKGVTLYLPYFDTRRVSRTMRVMPEVWECLEQCTMIMASAADLRALFPDEEPGEAFRNHLLFYCPRCLVTDYETLTMHFYDGESSWTRKCHPTADDCFHWTAGAVAGAVRALTEGMRDPDDIMERADETAHSRASMTDLTA